MALSTACGISLPQMQAFLFRFLQQGTELRADDLNRFYKVWVTTKVRRSVRHGWMTQPQTPTINIEGSSDASTFRPCFMDLLDVQREKCHACVRVSRQLPTVVQVGSMALIMPLNSFPSPGIILPCFKTKSPLTVVENHVVRENAYS